MPLPRGAVEQASPAAVPARRPILPGGSQSGPCVQVQSFL